MHAAVDWLTDKDSGRVFGLQGVANEEELRTVETGVS